MKSLLNRSPFQRFRPSCFRYLFFIVNDRLFLFASILSYFFLFISSFTYFFKMIAFPKQRCCFIRMRLFVNQPNLPWEDFLGSIKWQRSIPFFLSCFLLVEWSAAKKLLPHHPSSSSKHVKIWAKNSRSFKKKELVCLILASFFPSNPSRAKQHSDRIKRILVDAIIITSFFSKLKSRISLPSELCAWTSFKRKNNQWCSC